MIWRITVTEIECNLPDSQKQAAAVDASTSNSQDRRPPFSQSDAYIENHGSDSVGQKHLIRQKWQHPSIQPTTPTSASTPHSSAPLSSRVLPIPEQELFLEIETENGKVARRFFLGVLGCPCTRLLRSISFVTKGPVSLYLIEGRHRKQTGKHTLADFLRLSSSLSSSSPTEKVLTFAQRRRDPVYQLHYIIEPVPYQYDFSLSEITCLRSKSFLFLNSNVLPHNVKAEVEFNASPKAVNSTPTRTTFSLGLFHANDRSIADSNHHCSFSMHSSVAIQFRSSRGPVPSSVHSTLLDEWMLEIVPSFQRDRDPEEFWLNMDANANSDEPKQPVLPSSSSAITALSTSTDECILWTRSHGSEKEPLIFNPGRNQCERTVTITPADGSCSFLITLTITRWPILLSALEIQDYNAQLLPFQMAPSDDKLESILEPNANKKYGEEDREGARKRLGHYSLANKPGAMQPQFFRGERPPLPASSFTSPDYPPYAAPIDRLFPSFSKSSSNNYVFGLQSSINDVEVLIDGLETFERYYQKMMRANHSINILAWELSLTLGLVTTRNPSQQHHNGDDDRHSHAGGAPELNPPYPPEAPRSSSSWITLQDVLLWKASKGVKIRVMVWRHGFVSYMNRLLYLGEVTIENEVKKLKNRAEKMGLNVCVYHSAFNLPDSKSPHSDPHRHWPDADLVFVIVNNPNGIVSCHHEKLVLIDPECPSSTNAFMGGFDIARGRFDQPLHQPPLPYLNFESLAKSIARERARAVRVGASAVSTASSSLKKMRKRRSRSQQSPTKDGGQKKETKAEQEEEEHEEDDDDTDEDEVGGDSDSDGESQKKCQIRMSHSSGSSGSAASTSAARPAATLSHAANSSSNPSSEPNPALPPPRYGDSQIQPIFRHIRFLWHDLQMHIKGPATRELHLHFAQRWIHAFSRDNYATKQHSLPEFEECSIDHSSSDSIVAAAAAAAAATSASSASVSALSPVPPPNGSMLSHADGCSHSSSSHVSATYPCNLRLLRSWPGLYDTNVLLDDFCRAISAAKHSIYIEHQYAFQNYTTALVACEALKRNPELRIVVIVPVKTDLPTGIVGDLLDMSQDHMAEHLQLIYKAAPDRVGIYGLVREQTGTCKIKSIYVHAKLMIVDDSTVLLGSANMDNMSFFRASELNVNFENADLARETRRRLAEEHLEDRYRSNMATNFVAMFEAFSELGARNLNCIRRGAPLVGRPVQLAPAENHKLVARAIAYPSPVSKMMYKMGLEPGAVARYLVKDLQSSSDTNRCPIGP